MLSWFLTAALSLLTTQQPMVGMGSQSWELGTRIVADVPGRITAIRYWRLQGDPGPHVGKIWGPTGTLLATQPFVSGTASGWQEQALSMPLVIAAGALVTVSVNSPTAAPYAKLPGTFTTALVNGHLSAPPSAGAYSFPDQPGTFPSLSTPTSYFRDIVFEPDVPAGSISFAPDTCSAGGLLALLTGFPPGLYTATVSLQSPSGATVTASAPLTVPSVVAQ